MDIILIIIFFFSIIQIINSRMGCYNQRQIDELINLVHQRLDHPKTREYELPSNTGVVMAALHSTFTKSGGWRVRLAGSVEVKQTIFICNAWEHLRLTAIHRGTGCCGGERCSEGQRDMGNGVIFYYKRNQKEGGQRKQKISG